MRLNSQRSPSSERDSKHEKADEGKSSQSNSPVNDEVINEMKTLESVDEQSPGTSKGKIQQKKGIQKVNFVK
jgi:hypothetical protein